MPIFDWNEIAARVVVEDPNLPVGFAIVIGPRDGRDEYIEVIKDALAKHEIQDVLDEANSLFVNAKAASGNVACTYENLIYIQKVMVYGLLLAAVHAVHSERVEKHKEQEQEHGATDTGTEEAFVLSGGPVSECFNKAGTDEEEGAWIIV